MVSLHFHLYWQIKFLASCLWYCLDLLILYDPMLNHQWKLPTSMIKLKLHLLSWYLYLKYSFDPSLITFLAYKIIYWNPMNQLLLLPIVQSAFQKFRICTFKSIFTENLVLEPILGKYGFECNKFGIFLDSLRFKNKF